MVDSSSPIRWYQRAKSDIDFILLARENGVKGIEEPVCYNAHQAVEKLLKAFLLLNACNLPRTHDLLVLLGRCKTYDVTLLDFEDVIITLNDYSIAARYPSDFDESRSAEEALQAITGAYELYIHLSRYFVK